METLGILDIGTNSILSLIAQKDGQDKIQYKGEILRSPRLGEGLARTGMIRSESLERTIEAITLFQTSFLKNNVNDIYAAGTQVFRQAKNCMQTIEKIREKTGLSIHVLTPEQEARYSYLGALSDIEVEGDIVVSDIGGGSTEIVSGTKNVIKKSLSINIGAVQLRDRFNAKQPVSEEIWLEIRQKTRKTIDSIKWDNIRLSSHLIGVGGTVTSLAAIHHNLKVYDPLKVHGTVLTQNQLDLMIHKMRVKTKSGLRQWLAFDPGRADIILYGSAILKNLMQYGRFQKIQISNYGLRHGIAIDYFS